MAPTTPPTRPRAAWLRARKPMARLASYDSAAAFDPSSRMLATSGRSLRAWDTATGRLLWNVPLNLDLNLGAVTFSPDGTRVAIDRHPTATGPLAYRTQASCSSSTPVRA
ncbi:hypothetical protein ACTWPT_24215 [Nonomuraea sp. 3N208]|uniref:hypothetical protein n=1 Tax=Nonomuraea sp. 3N208 TaxID=3457421 RepID=UPI003FD6B186